MQRCCKSDHRAADGRRKGREGRSQGNGGGGSKDGRGRQTTTGSERVIRPARARPSPPAPVCPDHSPVGRPPVGLIVIVILAASRSADRA